MKSENIPSNVGKFILVCNNQEREEYYNILIDLLCDTDVQ